MKRKKDKAPDKIEISPDEEKALRERIIKNQLIDDDLQLLLSLLNVSQWIQGQLSQAKLTIQRLKKFFGFSSESNPNKNNDNNANNDPSENPSDDKSEEGALSTGCCY